MARTMSQPEEPRSLSALVEEERGRGDCVQVLERKGVRVVNNQTPAIRNQHM